MSKKDHVENIRHVLAAANVNASIRTERLTSITTGGHKTSGYRVSAELPELTADQRRAIHTAAMSLRIFGVNAHYHPMSGALHRLSSEGK